MTSSQGLAVMLAVTDKEMNRPIRSVLPIYPVVMGFIEGLGCRDSNPNYLIQSQASYH